jgi:hypothetical protein
MKSTNTKATITGSMIKIHIYKSKPLVYGSTDFAYGKIIEKSTGDDEKNKTRKLESRKRSIRRTRYTLINLINANAWQWMDPLNIPYIPLLATFTFAENIRDIKEANIKFSHFMQRLNYAVFNGSKKRNLKYVSVLEFQDMNRIGVIHFHTIFFNFQEDQKYLFYQIWKYGIIKIKEIKEIENVGLYISKTMSANNASDTRLDGYKRYSSSKGLLKPLEIRDQHNATSIQKMLSKEYIPSTEFFSGYQGDVEIKHYNIGNGENLLHVIPEVRNLLSE